MDDESKRTETLLDAASRGDDAARASLLEQYRGRLRRVVAVRLDRRLSSRLDASDIVQDALGDASRKLDDYLKDRPLPFYPWLHRLTTERIAQAHRAHIRYQARSVEREAQPAFRLPDESACELADRIASDGTSPEDHAVRAERHRLVRECLDRLPSNDREVLTMCYLEGLTFAEIASVLGRNVGAVKLRHFRALGRIRGLLAGSESDQRSP